MLVFGHTGITLGAAALVAGVVKSRGGAGMPWFVRLSQYMDIRLLLAGSLLPDIIDKPVGQLFFREALSSGRIYAHTLLFLVVMAAAGFFLFKRYRQVWLLTLAAGTLMHHIFDAMWNAPAVLFWPLLGFEFSRINVDVWLTNMWRGLFTNPSVYVPEIIGLAVLTWYGVTLVRGKRVGAFIRNGKA
ncbi:MAG: metal-dependent hydrolase [Chloroflexota bacterium]